jgi:NifU-like protein involved in Fe-S cluster formation
MIAGMPLESVRDLPQERLIAALQTEMRPARLHCAVLPLEVLKVAIGRDVR